MGSLEGSAVEERREAVPLPGYGRLGGSVPVLHPPHLETRAAEVRDLLEAGTTAMSKILDTTPPDAVETSRRDVSRRDVSAHRDTPALQALLVADEDWPEAPRESARPYPPGLPYFTQAATPPALVLPETLSGAFRPRTAATHPLAVWHELAHAFLLEKPVARAPAWLREFVPQALAAAVARRTGIPLDEHLSEVEEPGFTVRSLQIPATAERQMAFQNLLLRLGDAALDRFGEAWLGRLARALHKQDAIVDEKRAEELLGDALGPDGREWLLSRSEFSEGGHG